MECSLMLTTLSGETFQVSLSVAKFERFEDLEDQVMDYLVSVTNLKVFGCSIDFLQTATQTCLEDPIWRHVSVESGIRLIRAEAWQNCRQLRIVKLPATVVGISNNVFRDCKLLNSVLAPGCRAFGIKPLQNVVPCNGCMHRKGLEICSIAKPSLGNTSFKGVLTLLSLP